MIEISGLTKKFGGFTAVDNLSFSVKQGEVLGFLGPNGAGKSTTMKMITGFLLPSDGKVSVYGQDMSSNPMAAKRRIGYLPEGAPAYGEMTVLEFLAFIAKVRGVPKSQLQERVDHVVNKINLQKVVHKTVDTLSKGYGRRVGLAQAIIHDPDVLILDEPTDGLDPNQKYEVRKLISEMAAEKIIIVSTHILEEVEAVCTRAVIIADGKLLADGTPQELAAKSRYHHAVTLTVDGVDDAADQLGRLDGVDAVEQGASGRLTVVAQDGADIFTTIREHAEQNQWAVAELYIEQGRLDQVFRKLTIGSELTKQEAA
jgi:ABC-2 type transport system ATP-binding protein